MFAYCLNNPIVFTDRNGLLAYSALDIGEDGNDIHDPDSAGGAVWNTLLGTADSVSYGLNLAMGGHDGLSLAPSSPNMVSDKYIKQKGIDAHTFKREAGKVDKNMLSKYNIYKDTSNQNRLWVGSNNPKNRDWRMTDFVFDDLITIWRKW